MPDTKQILCILLLVPVLSLSVARTPAVTLRFVAARDGQRRVVAPPRASWKIEIETSGGLTGRGIGNTHVNSDGRAHITGETGDCERKLVALRLKPVSRAVTVAMPARWRKSYLRPDNPRGAADQIRYALRLTLRTGKRAKVYETFWFDETQERLPSDLRLLVEALNASRDELLAGCVQ